MFARPARAVAVCDDGALVARSVAGEAAAFGELARRHGSAVRALLRRMGAEPALADDLAQDAFLAGFQAIGGLHDRTAFPGWIKTIAARLYVRRWRRDRLFDLMAEPPEPEVATGIVGPAERLDLEAALATLTPGQRLCVSLCFGADLTHAEAAALLNVSLGTVKSHLARGLDKLRARMAQGGGAGSTTHG